jgi:predicted GNAT family acetyltransferase
VGSVDVDVVNVPERHRYEARVDGELAGYAYYRVRPEAIVFIHTETRPEFEGKGIGTALVRGALDAVRAAGGTVVAQCPFFAAYIRRHPEYGDLLVST